MAMSTYCSTRKSWDRSCRAEGVSSPSRVRRMAAMGVLIWWAQVV